MSVIPIQVLRDCLDEFEQQELRLLSWGDTDGFFSYMEVLEVIERVYSAQSYDSIDILDQLCEKAMLYSLPNLDGRSVRYRSRMAESVYLYRHLRQRFLNQSLEASRSLVSDFRFLRRPREYPKRDVSLSDYRSQTATAYQPILTALWSDPDWQLAQFQAKATTHILEKIQQSKPHEVTGTIICAGTGSGKTLAFYWPALIALTRILEQSSARAVRILAIYPRNELLKDQFAEAWQQSRALDDYVMQNGKSKRPIQIGALFGDVPQSERDVAHGQVYTVMSCPQSPCQGQLHWHKTPTALVVQCSLCQTVIDQQTIGLTRVQMCRQPPDILFTTSEMLNQRMNDPQLQRLFGIQAAEKPFLLLLDEVHTYQGSSGAQAAYLLRRWRHKSQSTAHVVGLSATLEDAALFFAELIGTTPTQVRLIEPHPSEMQHADAEYLLVLKGDPVSQTALLSTTIQTSMLTHRVLDTKPQQGKRSISNGTWGQRTFVFTDDLDLNNRLYFQLADAEGWYPQTRGQLSPKKTDALASLRVHADQRSIQGGQHWGISEKIGHCLVAAQGNSRAYVGRTSSQDGGVHQAADVVVATASLEVGFNDPTVGAVIQHKAPRDMAAYLQRKGRAGRARGMRPWMIVVLSDFGRDRSVFQRYERLLHPQLKRQQLPMSNTHIQKMQAAMAVLDWLGQQHPNISIWAVLKSPERYQTRLKPLQDTLERLINTPSRQRRLQNQINQILQLTPSQSDVVFWQPPRSIFLHFVPMLWRWLSTRWTHHRQIWQIKPQGSSPCPDFIPHALFAELNLPTLTVLLQRGRPTDPQTKEEQLAFYQALREFSPARISKRYAIRSAQDMDWLVPSDFIPFANPDDSTLEMDVGAAFGEELLPEDQVTHQGQTFDLYRPTQLYTCRVNPEWGVSERSHSRPDWRVAFQVDQPLTVDELSNGVWGSYLKSVSFALHEQHQPVQVSRYYHQATATLSDRTGRQQRVNFAWKKRQRLAVVGAQQWVDGVRFEFVLTTPQLTALLQQQRVLAAIRPQYFAYRVRQLPRFAHQSFQAHWVVECYLAALLAVVVQQDRSVAQAVAWVADPAHLDPLATIHKTLFQSDAQSEEEQLLQQQLSELLSDRLVVAELTQCAQALTTPLTADVQAMDWLKQLLVQSLAAAVQRMALQILPDAVEQSLIADTQISTNDGTHVIEVWLTETEGGGNGMLIELANAYRQDPFRVLSLLVHATQAGEYERLDADLFYLLTQQWSNPALCDAVANLRDAADMHGRMAAVDALKVVLQQQGVVLSHSLMSVLFSRVLVEGSDGQTDQVLQHALQAWHAWEDRTGMEWSLQAVAHTLALQQQPTTVTQAFQDYCDLQRRLWPRGHAIRHAELMVYHPFLQGDGLQTERLLLAPLFEVQVPEYQPHQAPQVFVDALRQAGQVDVVVSALGESVVQLIHRWLLNAIDYQGIRVYPRFAGVRRHGQQWRLRFELAEIEI